MCSLTPAAVSVGDEQGVLNDQSLLQQTEQRDQPYLPRVIKLITLALSLNVNTYCSSFWAGACHSLAALFESKLLNS